MKKWLSFRVGTRLALAFVAITAMLAVVAAIGISQLSVVRGNLNRVVNDDLNIALLNTMRDAVRFQAIALRDIVMQEDFSFKKQELKLIKEARSRYTRAAEQLAVRTTADHSTAGLLDALHSQEEAVKLASEAVVDLSLGEQIAAAGESVREKARPAQMKLIEQLDGLLDHYQAVEAQSVVHTEEVFTRAVTLIVVLGLISVALAGIVAVTITQSIARPLKKAVVTAKNIAAGDLRNEITVKGNDEFAELLEALREMNQELSGIILNIQTNATHVDESAQHLTKSTGEINARVNEQSELIMAVSAAMEQINVSVEEISSGAKSVLEAADKTQTCVTRGTANMNENIAANARIVETVTSSGDAIKELSESVEKITEITEVIEGIAGQTNLLALNAAIEAARAGDQGRGFSVVADEVRTLAQRTAKSTADIASIAAKIREKTVIVVESMGMVKEQVGSGAETNEAAGHSFTQIAESSKKTSDLAHQIAGATREQTVAHHETAKNMENINMSSEKNRENFEQIRDTATGMSSAATQLRHLVEKFKLAGN